MGSSEYKGGYEVKSVIDLYVKWSKRGKDYYKHTYWSFFLYMCACVPVCMCAYIIAQHMK